MTLNAIPVHPPRNINARMSPSRQHSLFEADSSSDQSLVEVLARNKPQNKAQAQFQRLIAKIERRREQLQLWQAFTPHYNERLASEFLPLQEAMRACQRKLATAIDELLSLPAKGRALGRVQRAKLRQLLDELLDTLVNDDADEALIALFDKYSDISYAEARESDMEMTQSLIEKVLGSEFTEEHDAANTDELLEFARRKLQEKVLEEKQRHQARSAEPGATPKAKAAQAKREQAAKEISQSIREVYRKLASALHPDREPDVDERQRKTLLIQRVNQAYEASDLLTLLELQLEIEQIDAAHLTNVAPERLAHYNQILRDQLADLDAEIFHHVLPFRETMGIPSRSIAPELVDRYLSADITQLRVSIKHAEQDLAALQDPKRLSALLKQVSLHTVDDDMDIDEFVDMMAMFAGENIAPAPRKRRR